MTVTEFKLRRVNIDKLLSFGFKAEGEGYVYHTNLVEGQLALTIFINASSQIYTEVTDHSSGEEYVLHRVTGTTGSFVSQVKSEYAAILDKISAMCFDPEVFKSEQAKAVITYVRDTYGDELEYLWQKFPNNAIVRRKDNRKWYAAILTVCKRKIGFDCDELIEIIDLRLAPEEMENTVDHVQYFPGYHMNKKHWITICLDGTVPIDEIYRRIDESYALAKKE